MVLCQGSLNPVYIKWDPCVDARSERPSTAKSPAGDSHLDPGTVVDTDQWSPRVTLRKKEDSPVKKKKKIKKHPLPRPQGLVESPGPPQRPEGVGQGYGLCGDRTAGTWQESFWPSAKPAQSMSDWMKRFPDWLLSGMWYIFSHSSESKRGTANSWRTLARSGQERVLA